MHETSPIIHKNFTDAVFEWKVDSQPDSFPIRVKFGRLAIAGYNQTDVELNIDHDGLRAQSIVRGIEGGTSVYLGNDFLVPAYLRRKGLGRAMVIALAQAHNIATYGDRRTDIPILLEGLFVNAGESFANRVCEGLPRKGSPSRLRPEVVKDVTERLVLVTSPEFVGADRT